MVLLEAPGPALDLHEGISTPLSEANAENRCNRWPSDLRLRSTLDHLVEGRCKATNLCDYCARLAAVENSELLALDALNGIAPLVWVVLTTPRADPDPKSFYRSREKLVLALRRRWPDLEYCALIEFTTGYGTRSGGKRRPHWNLLLKGVTPSDIPAIRALVNRVWCPRVDARPQGQHVGAVSEAGGLMRYIALHFQKESQRPTKGWRGHRFIPSGGYLWLPAPEARQEAKQSLRLKRELRRAERAGLEGEAALDAAHLALYEANELGWTLERRASLPAGYDLAGMPAEWLEQWVPVR